MIKKYISSANPLKETNEGAVHSLWVGGPKVSKLNSTLELGLEG